MRFTRFSSLLSAAGVVAFAGVVVPVIGQNVPVVLPSPHAFGATYDTCITTPPVAIVNGVPTKAPAIGGAGCYTAAQALAVTLQDPTKVGLSEAEAHKALQDPSSSAWQPSPAAGGSAANALGNAYQCHTCNVVLGVEYQNVNFNQGTNNAGAVIIYEAQTSCSPSQGWGWSSMPSGWGAQVSSSLNWPGSACNESVKFPSQNWSGSPQLDCPGIYPSFSYSCEYFSAAPGPNPWGNFNDVEQSVTFVN